MEVEQLSIFFVPSGDDSCLEKQLTPDKADCVTLVCPLDVCD